MVYNLKTTSSNKQELYNNDIILCLINCETVWFAQDIFTLLNKYIFLSDKKVQWCYSSK